IISLRRGIKLRNPQHVTKNYEICGGNVHSISDHNDIEWLKKKEALQAKKVKSFKETEAEDIAAAGCCANILWIKFSSLTMISYMKREPFTRSSNMYKEYLAEFWHSSKALEIFKVSFYVLTGGIYSEVGVKTFRNAIGAYYLRHSSEYVAPPSINIVRPWFETIRYGKTVPAKGTLKKSLLPPRWRDNSIARQVEEEGASNNIKLEDLAKLVSNMQSSFKDLDSPEDDHVIVVDDINEDEEDEVHTTTVAKTKDTSAPKSSSPRNKAKAKSILLKGQPSFPNVGQLNELLDIASKKAGDIGVPFAGQAGTQPIEGDSDDETHVSGSMVESSRIKKLKKFDFITEDGRHIHLTKEEINQQKKLEEDAKAKAAKEEREVRKAELVYLLGLKVVNKYYNDKLQYDRYCDKMQSRRAESRVTNCDVLTKKGPITPKVYREDGTSERIPNYKASDLHLREWREVVQACPKRTGKGWKTIYGKIQTRMDYLHTTEATLGVNLDILLSEKDPLKKSNDLVNKKRNHADDIHEYFKANKRLKSPV
nr:hypothetical protein [Tanacetum cinerariifolium]